jgi:hypothetical protein
LLWQTLSVRLDENLDRFLARVNLDPNGIIAEVHLMSATVLSAYDGMAHPKHPLSPSPSSVIHRKRNEVLSATELDLRFKHFEYQDQDFNLNDRPNQLPNLYTVGERSRHRRQ